MRLFPTHFNRRFEKIIKHITVLLSLFQVFGHTVVGHICFGHTKSDFRSHNFRSHQDEIFGHTRCILRSSEKTKNIKQIRTFSVTHAFPKAIRSDPWKSEHSLLEGITKWTFICWGPKMWPFYVWTSFWGSKEVTSWNQPIHACIHTHVL